MLSIRSSALMRAVVLPITLGSFLSACHKWVPVEDPIAESIAEDQPRQVRVTTKSDQIVVLDKPVVREGSVVGVGPNAGPLAPTFEAELESIRSVEVWQVPPTVPKAQWLSTPIPVEQLCEDGVARIRVTLDDGRRIPLNDPRVEGDRLIGQTDPYYVSETAIPLSRITVVEERKTNTTAVTVAFVVGAVVGALLIVYATSAPKF